MQKCHARVLNFNVTLRLACLNRLGGDVLAGNWNQIKLAADYNVCLDNKIASVHAVSSVVKAVIIPAVPDRGGVPEGDQHFKFSLSILSHRAKPSPPTLGCNERIWKISFVHFFVSTCKSQDAPPSPNLCNSMAKYMTLGQKLYFVPRICVRFVIPYF